MMIQMFVAGIGIEGRSGLPVVLLNDVAKHQAVPIAIGVNEAKALSRALQKANSKRPSTHELLFDVISGFGYDVDHVAIDQIDDDTYCGKVALAPENTDHTDLVFEIDARASDALVLAVMRDVPIYVSEEIISKSGITLQNEEDTEASGEHFKAFIKELKASDFNKHGSGPVELPE
jgi:bifunctional DNase/RNase